MCDGILFDGKADVECGTAITPQHRRKPFAQPPRAGKEIDNGYGAAGPMGAVC